MEALIKTLKTFQAYCHYIVLALVEIYPYYTSPFPSLILMKNLTLAHRKIRIIWAPKSLGFTKTFIYQHHLFPSHRMGKAAI